MKEALNSILLIVAMILLGYLLMVFVYLIPVDLMHDNIAESSYVLEEEGNYPWLIPGVKSSILDNITDANMLNIAGTKSPNSVFAAAILNYLYVLPNSSTIDILASIYGRGGV